MVKALRLALWQGRCGMLVVHLVPAETLSLRRFSGLRTMTLSEPHNDIYIIV